MSLISTPKIRHSRFVWPAVAFIGLLLVACSSDPDVPGTPIPTQSEPTATAVSDSDSEIDEDFIFAYGPKSGTVDLSDLPDDPSTLMWATLDQPLDRVGRKMAYSGNQAFIPVLLEYLRFQQDEEGIIKLTSFLSRLKDNVPPMEVMLFPPEQNDWGWWIEWLGNNPQVQAPDGFAAWKGSLYSILDAELGAFLYEGVKTSIRIEEIVWGGVTKDGIPDLIDPPVVSADEADYLLPGDRVFGVSINGEHRAYPLRIMNPHEMANDVLGGVPFALAY